MSKTTINPFVNQIRSTVRAMAPYSLEHVDAQVKLDMNENPIDMPAEIKEKVIRLLRERQWTRYPELIPQRLLEKLSAVVGWPVGGLLVGNGSNEILMTVLVAIATPMTVVTVVQPSFSVYRTMVELSGAQYRQVLLTPEFQFDIGAIVKIAAQSDILIVCTPNNPTGSLLGLDAIRQILTASRGLVVVDEAYHEFSGQTALPLLREFQNLILLRTFSKAMAMGGLRVGYLMSDPALAPEIGKAKMPYNLNFVSLAAAEASLDHNSLLRENVQQVIRWREDLSHRLKTIPGVEVFPTGSNFILVRTNRPASEVYESLYARSILVRDVSRAPLLDRCLRITVGTAEENERLVTALRTVLKA